MLCMYVCMQDVQMVKAVSVDPTLFLPANSIFPPRPKVDVVQPYFTYIHTYIPYHMLT